MKGGEAALAVLPANHFQPAQAASRNLQPAFAGFQINSRGKYEFAVIYKNFRYGTVKQHQLLLYRFFNVSDSIISAAAAAHRGSLIIQKRNFRLVALYRNV